MIDEKKLVEKLEAYKSNWKMADDFNEGIAQGLHIAIRTAKHEPKVFEWIPVKDRLPEKENELYWTTHEDGSIVLHGYRKENGFIYNWEVDDLEKRKRQGSVIAWMLIPCPDPYEEGLE